MHSTVLAFVSCDGTNYNTNDITCRLFFPCNTWMSLITHFPSLYHVITDAVFAESVVHVKFIFDSVKCVLPYYNDREGLSFCKDNVT